MQCYTCTSSGVYIMLFHVFEIIHLLLLLCEFNLVENYYTISYYTQESFVYIILQTQVTWPTSSTFHQACLLTHWLGYAKKVINGMLKSLKMDKSSKKRNEYTFHYVLLEKDLCWHSKLTCIKETIWNDFTTAIKVMSLMWHSWDDQTFVEAMMQCKYQYSFKR